MALQTVSVRGGHPLALVPEAADTSPACGESHMQLGAGDWGQSELPGSCCDRGMLHRHVVIGNVPWLVLLTWFMVRTQAPSTSRSPYARAHACDMHLKRLLWH